MIKLSEDRIEKIRTLPNIQSLINESVLHIKDSKSSNDKISGQISLKKKWLRLISEAKYEKVIEEIRDIAIDEDKNEWLENILNISSRWHLLQEQIHKNIGNQADISTELNKINQALLNFIRNLNDTEEV